MLVGAAMAAEPGLYEKRATWVETMLASRALCVQESQQAGVEWGAWYATSPMKADNFAQVHVPVDRVDLKAAGPNGQPLWQPRPDWTDRQTCPLPTSRGSETTYLARTMTVKQPATLVGEFSSDDGLEVWLNGQKLLSQGAVTNGVTADLALKAGENQLLVKIHNSGGDHSYRFAANPNKRPASIWPQVKADFPVQSGWFERHMGGRHLEWFAQSEKAGLEQDLIDRALRELGSEGDFMRGELEQLAKAETPAGDGRWLTLYEKVCRYRYRPAELKQVNVLALRLAMEDLIKTYGGRYARGQEFLGHLGDLEKQVADLEMAIARGDNSAAQRAGGLVERFQSLRRDALLANPALDFDRLLLVKRKDNRLGLPQNWQGNCSLPAHGYDNEIALLSPVRPDGKLATFFKPEKEAFVGDVDLHFDAQKMLFSMPNSKGRWQVHEIGVEGKGLRQVTSDEPDDVDNYDACYLPNGRIVFCSSRCFHGVPCVGGGDKVANLFLMDADGSNVRQLCFDQDHNWCPTVLNNGRVLYTRWEYSDSPHYFTRLLFHMNPDGTNQAEYYASNSMWPNSTFYAQPIPNHPTKVVAVISGHHGVPRMGELVLFDPGVGRHEATGAVQRIPGHGRKVKPVITDGLVEGSWPKFLHPYPLSDKYFLVSAKPTPQSSWGLYLIDAFDNLLLLQEQPGYALFEPVPLRKRPTPPVIPDQVEPSRQDAVVYMADVYYGKGLQDVPRGTVKKLRIYGPHYAYPGMGGHINIGIDGPWDVKRIYGTVPVEPDGSASFRIPANTPLSVEPLDADGKALQVMRSWFTAMPGETVSCVGCHESQNSSPPRKPPLALRRTPSEITPWYGPVRGFSFKREVQPVLDKYCVGCHNGQPADRLDLTLASKSRFGNFTPSYVALHPFVRRPGPESDYFLQKPLEWHASTSELVQMLEKGHYNVKLDAEAWDRLLTWIDLNVPDHGTWHEHRGGHSPMEKRRLEMRTAYANRPEDPEAIPGVDESQPPPKTEPIAFVKPQPLAERSLQLPSVAGWPFDTAEAKRRQASAGLPPEVKLELAPNVVLEMVLIPAGEFVLGDPAGEVDEIPVSRVKIDRPFYLSRTEITNAQFALFDAGHDSAYISMTNKDHSHRGHAVNGPAQPVVRINWQQAMAFCQWLSQRAGRKACLPTEAQWEWACRAGTATPLSFGAAGDDFSKFANLADAALTNFAERDSPKWHPRVERFNDGAMISTNVARYQPNAWGLCDMHGNVAEWTRTAYRPYPYDTGDGRDDPNAPGAKVVRGGSWYDQPYRATSSFRVHYQPWQRVYNVGFRVAIEGESVQ
jgi:formylglycine-generating enzyme required for sulfatase activity